MLAIASILNNCSQRWFAPGSLRGSWHWLHDWLRLALLAAISLTVGTTATGCREQAIANPRQIALEQSWELASGDPVEGFVVVASLGDISIRLDGARVRAPFDGEVEQAATGEHCVFFSAPEVPAYLFRYCGLKRPRLGLVRAGQPIGRAQFLHFATLRRQPEGTWVIVEPSTQILERSLQRY